MSRSRRGLSWLAMTLVAVAALAYGSVAEGGPQTAGERTTRLWTEFACPRCNGQSVAESNAPIAVNIRSEIARQVDVGRTDDEIAAVLIGRYGESVRLTPSSSGVVGLVWMIPVMALVVGAGVLALAFRRWSTRTVRPISPADRELVARYRDGSLDLTDHAAGSADLEGVADASDVGR